MRCQALLAPILAKEIPLRVDDDARPVCFDLSTLGLLFSPFGFKCEVVGVILILRGREMYNTA